MHSVDLMATFDEDVFEARLESLKDTQEGIQQMSAWCLQHRVHHKRIVASWLNVFRKVRVEHRLILFYLANDVIQHSKRKRYDFVDSWATALQRATTMVRDEKVKDKILRIFRIWEQRDIYNEDYLSDLRGLLNISPPKKPQAKSETGEDFQNTSLVNHVRQCSVLSEATDRSFKKIPKSPAYDITNIESVKAYLKDRSHSEEVKNDFLGNRSYLETYTENLGAEIKSRKMVLADLQKAIKYYAEQKGEVKVVVNAYKNFGTRIKMVKKKLDELTTTLPSPIPSPDINAPSPEPDTDLQLPDDQSSNISMDFFKTNLNGYSGYLGGKGTLPFDISDFKSSANKNNARSSSHPIEVIGSRSDDESYSSAVGVVEYYKPEPISPFPRGSGNNSIIPGLSPMPVPPVTDGYSSLARSSQQYANILPPPNPPLFGGTTAFANTSAYTPQSSHLSGYNNTDSGGGGGGYHDGQRSQQPLMPPPPMPPLSVGLVGTLGDGGGVGGGNNGRSSMQSSSSEDYNSTWDMSMSWTQLDTSNASSTGYGGGVGGGNSTIGLDTPHSPPHFERESNATAGNPLEYRELGTSVMGTTEDVDHRQLGLRPPFSIGSKLGLSQEKSRQLDIDHRNLISLTDSPGANDSEKNTSWLSMQDVDFRSNHTGDVDYRSSASVLRAIETTPTSESSNSKGACKISSSTPSKSSDSLKDKDSVSRTSNDMVVDMDMSDEDVEDIYRENSTADLSASSLNNSKSQSAADDNHTRPPLLDTPHDYDSTQVWDAQSSNYPGAEHQHQHQQQQQQANAANAWPPQMWNGGNGGGGGNGPNGNVAMGVPPPPRPPYPMQYQYPNSGGEFNSPRPMGRGGGGRGRGWSYGGGGGGGAAVGVGGGPRGGNPFAAGRNNSPYFSRGRGGGAPSPGGMRGNYRGKFRGHNNAWI